MNDFIPKGIQFLKLAVRFDENQKYPEALRHYIIALEYFLAGMKYSKIPQVRDILRLKIKEFLSRAESIKAFLESQKQKQNQRGKQQEKTNEKTKSQNSKEKTSLRRQLEDVVLKEKPNITFNDVAGLETPKKTLEEAILLPYKFPQLFRGKRKAWKGILLYGPPGTGKSYIAKALAGSSNATFFSLSSADIVSKYVGESEKLVKELFQMAREQAPSIIFIDEIDAICGQRSDNENDAIRRLKTELLIRMSELENVEGVLVLAATNRPFDLDSAFRRRFEKQIYIPLPDYKTRLRLFEMCIGDECQHFRPNFLSELASATEGYSCSDIATLVREAFMIPVRNAVKATHWKPVPHPTQHNQLMMTPCHPSDPSAVEISMMNLEPQSVMLPELTEEMFMEALQRVKPTVSRSDIAAFEEYNKLHGVPQYNEQSLNELFQELEKTSSPSISHSPHSPLSLRHNNSQQTALDSSNLTSTSQSNQSNNNNNNKNNNIFIRIWNFVTTPPSDPSQNNNDSQKVIHSTPSHSRSQCAEYG